MRLRWWYGVGVATVVWALSFLALGIANRPAAIERITGPIVAATLVAWPLMPVCIYLDQRHPADDLAWNPRVGVWIGLSFVWFLNVVVGTAYCLRRYSATRRRVPGTVWESVVVGSLAIWLVAFVLDYGVPDGVVAGDAGTGIAAAVALAWLSLPLAIYLDAVRVHGYTDWHPNIHALVLGAAIPFVNVLVAAGYLYRRRDVFPDDGSASLSLPDSDSGNEGPDLPGSPWFRRSGYVFGVYALLVVGGGLVAPSSLSETGFELLAVLAWVPFGPFFAICVYKDAAWRRDHDYAVGDTWWLYLLSGLVQGAAFWYLLRRATKSSRYRRSTRGPTSAEE